MSEENINLAKRYAPEAEHVPQTPGAGSQPIGDEELVRRAQRDDPWAVEQLIGRYQKKVYGIAYHMLSGDAEEARDRTQEAFLQALRNIKRFKGNSSFYTWLYRIVVNRCIDAQRRRRRLSRFFFPRHSGKNSEKEFNSSVEDYPDENISSNPLSTLNRRQLAGDLKKALKSLPQKQRTVFQLKIFQEMSISEIAEITGLAKGTVKTHLFRATRAVQKQLRPWTET